MFHIRDKDFFSLWSIRDTNIFDIFSIRDKDCFCSTIWQISGPVPTINTERSLTFSQISSRWLHFSKPIKLHQWAQSSTLAIYPLKNASNNGISPVENSRMLLVDFVQFSGKFRTMSSVTEVHLPSGHWSLYCNYQFDWLPSLPGLTPGPLIFSVKIPAPGTAFQCKTPAPGSKKTKQNPHPRA